MIVGHKIEQYLTAEQRDYNRYWVVTTHRVVTELHATKGWRQIGRSRHVQHVSRLPPIGEWRDADITRFERVRKPGPVIAIDFSPVPERALMRHGWYRRKLRNEAEQRVKARLDAGEYL